MAPSSCKSTVRCPPASNVQAIAKRSDESMLPEMITLSGFIPFCGSTACTRWVGWLATEPPTRIRSPESPAIEPGSAPLVHSVASVVLSRDDRNDARWRSCVRRFMPSVAASCVAEMRASFWKNLVALRESKSAAIDTSSPALSATTSSIKVKPRAAPLRIVFGVLMARCSAGRRR